jgi:tyrosyl-tRNA synthetase
MTQQFKSDFLNILQERGLLYQCSDVHALDDQLSQGICTAYIGYDATAKSLHIGNLVTVMMLRRFQQAGHKPMVLMGGGTTRVGDPSGKDTVRQLLDDDAINQNINSLKSIYAQFLRFDDSATGAQMVNNADWLLSLNYVDFLRDYGRHFSVNRMLGMDSVKSRLEREQNLSFLEFNYSILQAYDFVELKRRYNVILQLGGSDQWGNIVSGVDLGRRVLSEPIFALTCPLLLNSEGKKMGKSVDGAIWLNADMRTPYEYYQYFRNVNDQDVGKILRFFTDIPMDEIHRLESLQGSEINHAKEIAAFEITKMCHGENAATSAQATARATFADGGVGDDLPIIILDQTQFQNGEISLVDVMVASNLVTSKSEARRAIEQGGVKINNEKCDDVNHTLKPTDLNQDLKLSVGKKKHCLVRL